MSEMVKRGHDQAAELKSSCGAVDVRDVAQLISDLATQLDVQLARSNALAAENAGLKSKGRELLTEACSVYEKFNATINSEDGDFIDGQTLHEFQFVLDCETPVTDAFLAEVRAQGVDMLAEKLRENIAVDSSGSTRARALTRIVDRASDQIRKGVQS